MPIGYRDERPDHAHPRERPGGTPRPARVYGKLGHLDAAVLPLRVALAIAPQYRPARAEVHRLLSLPN